MKKIILSIGCFVASVFSFAGDNPSSYNTGNSDPGPNFIGSHLEKKHKDEIRPMTDEEKKLRRQSLIYISGIFLLVVALFILANFLSK
jgi:hypothetical protein